MHPGRYDAVPHHATLCLAADRDAIDRAALLLRAGEAVAFPTETVYGLGADATNGTAVAKIYAAKGRPSFNPLIVHVPDLAAAEQIAVFDPASLALARRFWPGPLTLVLARRPDAGVSDLVTAGLDTVAIRVPAHPVARALLAAAGRPLAAPSANRSGHISPTTAAHVMADLSGRIPMVLDGGACPVGVESTIAAVMDGRIRLLRHGGVSRAELAATSGLAVDDTPVTDDHAPVSPGLLASHYAPGALVRLEATALRPGEAFLGFGPIPDDIGATAVAAETLSAGGDPVEAAANLFSALRRLDASGATTIAVAPIPEHGLGEAINDRLRRAAAPRPAPAPSVGAPAGGEAASPDRNN
ncbi:L-threonylcarbamoyladenylate synthase [Methylobrevis pamukkalensis]|uniref:Threonylcarbamoyl-AMP synthase n=1 Tax=Methylobrevis pamukkalensis TaxID=1439726 RepID=A0A1E3H1T7_9HYPH|nr:L-threonylcarbamoyladenylate synthase [Methylobrevis pamukkalensis]ODN69756.1 Threonylcarbamoyl-AMP synthase [Methylobrevis pamukkalensis]